MIWSLNAMEYKTKFSPVFRPPFRYSTSEYRTSVCLFFRWFHYSDVWYSDPQWESEIQHFKIWTFWQSDFKWSSAQRVGLSHGPTIWNHDNFVMILNGFWQNGSHLSGLKNFKFWRIGVPARGLFLRRISKFFDFSWVEGLLINIQVFYLRE